MFGVGVVICIIGIIIIMTSPWDVSEEEEEIPQQTKINIANFSIVSGKP